MVYGPNLLSALGTSVQGTSLGGRLDTRPALCACSGVDNSGTLATESLEGEGGTCTDELMQGTRTLTAG